MLRGETERLRDEGPALLAIFPPESFTLPAHALVRGITGERTEAIRLLTLFDFSPNDAGSLVQSAQACEALQDVALAERLYPMLLNAASTYPVLWGPQGTALFGPTLRLAGEMACIVGRLADAARHFDEAIELSRRLQLPALVQLCERSRRRLEIRSSHPERGRG